MKQIAIAGDDNRLPHTVLDDARSQLGELELFLLIADHPVQDVIVRWFSIAVVALPPLDKQLDPNVVNPTFYVERADVAAPHVDLFLMEVPNFQAGLLPQLLPLPLPYCRGRCLSLL